MSGFNKKKKYLDSIEHIDRKIAWIKYEDLKEKIDEIKQDKIKATEIYNELKKNGKPMEEEINATKKKAKQLESFLSNIVSFNEIWPFRP